MFSIGALIVLRRTAKAIEWYLIYLLRIEEKYYSNQIFRAYWTRRNYSKSSFRNTLNAGEKKTEENCFPTSLPISQILSVYVPMGSMLFWFILLVRSILKYCSVI